MQICDAMKSMRIAAAPVILVLFGIPAVGSAQATSPAPATLQLQPYTAPDKSASAGVPYGWQVTQAGSGTIAMAGPQGEAVNIEVIAAYDGPFQLGQKGPSGAEMTMPSSAKLSDKLVMVLEQQAALQGMPVPQFKFLYAAPINMASGMGQCGMFAINAAGSVNPDDAVGIFCSFADSSANFFKSFLMYGAAPTTIAVQALPTVEAVLKSYRLAPGWTQTILSPYTPASSAGSGSGGPGNPSRASGNANTDDGPGLGGGYDPGPGGSAGYPNNPSNANGAKSTMAGGPGGSGYPNNPPNANSTKSTALDGPGGSGYPNPSRASGGSSTDDGPGLGGGYNPGPGGSGYPNNPSSANGAKSTMAGGPGGSGYPNVPSNANSAKSTALDGPGGSGYPNPSRASGSSSTDDGPGLGGGYNPGPGGSGYPNNPSSANGAKSTALDGPGGSGYPNPSRASGGSSTYDGPGLGGGYNPGPGGSAGYPNNPPDGSSVKSTLADGPGGSAGYPYNGSDPNGSYPNVFWGNQQVIDRGFRCVDASIVGSGSAGQTPVECGGWKLNF